MASETVVAVFSSLTHAEGAISDLVAAGIPSSSIRHYAQDEADATVETPHSGIDTHHRHGFWAWLTGEENNNDHYDAYDRSIASGRIVVTVVADGSNVEHVYSTLERHEPLQLEEHEDATASTDRTANTMTGGAPVAAPSVDTGTAGTGRPNFEPRVASAADTTRSGRTEEVIPLSEENLSVGKREVNLGTTRVRRYVVERPVEEQVRLRDETVSVFRRPVTGAAPVGTDAFRDREITMNETSEEAVVGKSTRVVEEVVVQKGVQERVETVHDTVRRDEVEIDRPEGTADRNPGSAI